MNEKYKILSNELEIELKDNILKYWIVNAVDEKNGGYYGHIDFYNKVLENAPKGSVLNARILWTFSAAYNKYRNPEYLIYARRAFEYIKNKFIDTKNGGVFWELDSKGNPINTRKQIYALSFVIYGMTEFYKGIENKEALQIAQKLFMLIEKYSFDRKNNGYIEAFSGDWLKLDDYRLSEKDANWSKTMNTHLHILEAYTNLYRVWKDPILEEALENLIHLFIEKFVDPDTYNLNLFFDDEWNLKSSQISFGHDIECSWLLYEAAEVLNNTFLLEKVRDISINMTKATLSGLDKDHGLFNEKFPLKDKIDTDKHWWPQAEAMVGFYNAYQLTGEELYAEKTLNSWVFIKKNIIDHKNGEWYWRVNKEGKPYIQDEKAGFWKCPYHNSRACLELINRIK